EDIERMRAHFAPHPYEVSASDDTTYAQKLRQDSAFAAFVKRNVKEHRASGYKIVFASLKARDVAPGDITADQLDAVADLADRYSFGEVRSTHDQNLVLAEVK